MAGEMVPLEFGPGFVPGPSGWEFMTDPIDVSEFDRATLVVRGEMIAPSDGQELALIVQESNDTVTWADPSGPRIRIRPDAATEETTSLSLHRLWLRLKVVFGPLVPGRRAHRPVFHARLIFEKRKP